MTFPNHSPQQRNRNHHQQRSLWMILRPWQTLFAGAGGAERQDRYQTVSTGIDYDDNSNNNSSRRSGSNSNSNKKITDYSSRRCEILTNIQELQILQNDAKTVEEKEACQKGVIKNVQDLKNLNVQEQANWFQDVT